MFKLFKNLLNVVYGLIIIVLVIFAGLVTVSALDIPNGISLFMVQSGSMAPAIPTGSLVLIKPMPEYQVGDVITFKTEAERNVSHPQNTVTHRLVEIKQEEKGRVYLTKGDANQVADGNTLSPDLVLGKTLFHLPGIGYVLSFVKTKEGLIFLIIIPATIIIYNELLSIKNELKKVLSKRKSAKKAEQKTEDLDSTEE